ncbi:MAG: hypothetical protein WAW41_01835, partial [Methylobacter sp.]
ARLHVSALVDEGSVQKLFLLGAKITLTCSKGMAVAYNASLISVFREEGSPVRRSPSQKYK